MAQQHTPVRYAATLQSAKQLHPSPPSLSHQMMLLLVVAFVVAVPLVADVMVGMDVSLVASPQISRLI